MDEVVLWKAPQQGRAAALEILNGFDPKHYPGDGPFFTTVKAIAEDFQRVFQNGLQEIHLPMTLFSELVDRGIIKHDAYYLPGQSYCVPAERIAEFNEAIEQGATGKYHPEKTFRPRQGL